VPRLFKAADLSLRHGLPVVIHARESFHEIVEILEGYRNKGLTGIFHAFTGTPEIARQVTGMGFKLGIGGIVTYKNSPFRILFMNLNRGPGT